MGIGEAAEYPPEVYEVMLYMLVGRAASQLLRIHPLPSFVGYLGAKQMHPASRPGRTGERETSPAEEGTVEQTLAPVGIGAVRLGPDRVQPIFSILPPGLELELGP
ncbi:MAG: hypothetical protein M3Q29_15540 [Chloroflexota bacterium]|nr:hypothetical protein [Chloroflexota bacterium]